MIKTAVPAPFPSASFPLAGGSGKVSPAASLFDNFIIPNWPAPANVRSLQTTRRGGVSVFPYESLNLGSHVGDSGFAVAQNRRLLNCVLPGEPMWMEQVHGTRVADADNLAASLRADACTARRKGSICAVMTADCLPVLLCDTQGTVVAAVHAGWRGLAAGVTEAAILAMGVAPQHLMVWLGPAISQPVFEVGADVRAAFVDADELAASAFICCAPGKYLADLYALARLRLNALGITQIYGGDRCTFIEEAEFFSYRRDGVTGRQGTFIWLDG